MSDGKGLYEKGVEVIGTAMAVQFADCVKEEVKKGAMATGIKLFEARVVLDDIMLISLVKLLEARMSDKCGDGGQVLDKFMTMLATELGKIGHNVTIIKREE